MPQTDWDREMDRHLNEVGMALDAYRQAVDQGLVPDISLDNLLDLDKPPSLDTPTTSSIEPSPPDDLP